MKNKFSKYLTGFRKCHNAQHSLLRMIESWNVQLNNGGKVGAIIMDLSKAFDNLNHNLLLTNLKLTDLKAIQLSFSVATFLADTNVVKYITLSVNGKEF